MIKKIIIGIVVLIVLSIGALFVGAKLIMSSYGFNYKTIDTTDQTFYDYLDETNDIVLSKEKLKTKDFVNIIKRGEVFISMDAGKQSAVTTKTKLKEILGKGDPKKVQKITKEIEINQGIENITNKEFQKIRTDYCTNTCLVVAADDKTLLIFHLPKNINN